MKKILSIAGSDCSGGAGTGADLKTIITLGGYGMSAITALTAQNTMGVFDVLEVSPEFLKKQIDAVFEDIYPDAVKIGMISNGELVETVGERLLFYKAGNIVLDPVMVATSGSTLSGEGAVSKMKRTLLPICTLVTPNLYEAEVLSEMKICSKEDMITAAKRIYSDFGCSVLLKGGHIGDNADDLLFCKEEVQWIEGERINNPNTHGTGCTLSSAIATYLAMEYSLYDAVCSAKEYLSKIISAGLDIGKGRGPLNHGYR